MGARVLAAADARRRGPMLAVAAYTGLRRGELCGLAWDAVDLDAGAVHVVRQVVVVRGGKQLQEEPKTSAGRRDVPLVVQAAQAVPPGGDLAMRWPCRAGERVPDRRQAQTHAPNRAGVAGLDAGGVPARPDVPKSAMRRATRSESTCRALAMTACGSSPAASAASAS